MVDADGQMDGLDGWQYRQTDGRAGRAGRGKKGTEGNEGKRVTHGIPPRGLAWPDCYIRAHNAVQNTKHRTPVLEHGYYVAVMIAQFETEIGPPAGVLLSPPQPSQLATE